MTALRQKIAAPHTPLIFYELIPPSQEAGEEAIHAYAECAAELVTSATLPIDAINVPEIRAEQRLPQRVRPYEPKADQRQFAQLFKRHLNHGMDLIVNRCTVYEDWPLQRRWLRETSERFDIHNLILVGGESSQLPYLGPSVVEMAQSIRQLYDQSFLCGGVTIPTRRSADPQQDEPQRLIVKGAQGLAFFTSQVLYESLSAKALLRDYHRLCREQSVQPKRIFLSFAPVSSRKDLEFLRWLGVFIPAEVESVLLKADIGIGWRSLQVAKRLLQDILEFVQGEEIHVPLGLNVEHITRRNFELSREFIEQLGALYYAYAKELP